MRPHIILKIPYVAHLLAVSATVLEYAVTKT